MTRSASSAPQNPYVDGIGHLTGRLINTRDAYELDVGAVFKRRAHRERPRAERATRCRLDVTDVVCRRRRSRA